MGSDHGAEGFLRRAKEARRIHFRVQLAGRSAFRRLIPGQVRAWKPVLRSIQPQAANRQSLAISAKSCLIAEAAQVCLDGICKAGINTTLKHRRSVGSTTSAHQL
jgi:hypothetical protein